MADQLTLKTDKKPSYINREAFMGAFIGIFLPVPVPGGDAMSAFCGALFGLVLGSVIGFHRMKKEVREGKLVGQASFWNKDTLLGALFGNHFGGTLGMTAAMAIAVAGLASAGVDITGTALLSSNDVSYKMANLLVEQAPVYAVATTGVFLTSWMGGALVGSYVGGKAGEKRQIAEYNLALQQQVALQQGRSQQVSQSVEYAVEHSKDWGKTVEIQKSNDISNDKGRA